MLMTGQSHTTEGVTMQARERHGFRFGLESEYMLVAADTFRPLWHQDLNFAVLSAALESIKWDDLPPLAGLDLEPPHRKLMPFAVEGYHVPDPELNPIDLLPKGVEIRTPVCDSIEACLSSFCVLYERMQAALEGLGYRAVALSHHPTQDHFEGPQNKRRYDFWQWAMETMTTYGPDINVSLPTELDARLDPDDLHAKVNYYGPAMAALTLASPICRGDLWRIRGRVGKSIRTYRRSVIAPAIELHPHEGGRLEFKLFEMTNRVEDFHAYFLLWLGLVLDDELPGRASNQTRIYDLGRVAQFGLEDDAVCLRAAELLKAATSSLDRWDFDTAALSVFRGRLEQQRVPADDIIDEIEAGASVTDVLRSRSQFCCCTAQSKPVEQPS